MLAVRLHTSLVVLTAFLPMGAWAQEAARNSESPSQVGAAIGSWEEGIRPELRSEWLNLRFGGKAMFDSGSARGQDAASSADLGDVSDWRRLRPFVEGTVADRLDFKIEMEFMGPRFRWMDLYVRLRDVPGVPEVTVGHFKEPFGLEELTGSANTTFLERALPGALTPGRSLGVMAHDARPDERATWSLGVFRSLMDEPNFPNGRGGEAWAVTGRTTWLPWQDEKTGDLLHVGASASVRSLLDEARFRQRPEAHLVDYLTDTGSFKADAAEHLGMEAAWVHGPLSFQGEYVAALAERPDDDAAFLRGAYVQASYFLTGEHRPYDRKAGVFKSTCPLKPFPTSGVGAWEVAARYSFLDLAAPDLPNSSRFMQDFTGGLNWYLNPNVRVGWNYVHSWADGPGSSGQADVFLFRLQVSF